MQTEHKKQTFNCHICHQRYSNKNNVDRHIKTAHLNPNQIYCSVCKENFNNSQGLNQHVRQQHQLEQRLSVQRQTKAAARQRQRLGIFSDNRCLPPDLKNAAFQYQSSIEYHLHPGIQIGTMNSKCSFCGALKWKGESPGMCCSSGKVKIPKLDQPPEPLHSLLHSNQHFLSNIRNYNSCFQMTSFGATKVIKEKGFMPTFKIQGQVYHNIGSLLPQPDSDPKYLQVYFIGDAGREAAVRSSHNPSTKAEIVLALQEFFHKNNPYVKELKTSLEKIEHDDGKVIIRADKAPKDQHAGRYNAPTVSEVAILL